MSLVCILCGIYVCASIQPPWRNWYWYRSYHGILGSIPGANVQRLNYLQISSDETPGGPKNSDGLYLGIYTFVYVYKVHLCMCMLGGEMRSWTNCFVL